MGDIIAPFPDNEFERVLKLSEYDIDYSEIKGKLNNLTRLAAFVAGTPISLINLLDTTTQWTVSSFGLDIHQLPRERTVCQYVVLENDAVEIEEMNQDKRFKDQDYVTRDPFIQYYYGIPLTTPDGFKIGAMCVMDNESQELSPEKKDFLKIIAHEVMTRIEYEHKLKVMRKSINELQEIHNKVSHDIRSPISGIINIAEILRDQAKEEKMDELMEFMELINKGGRSVLDLADEILSTYKGQNGSAQITSDQITLPVLKEKLENLYEPQAQSKSISYDVTLANEHRGVEFPKSKLLQILGNLISNAIKFTPENGFVQVELNIKKTDKTLIAKVKDNGVGISPEQIEKLLNDEVESTPGTGNEKGYGFGMKLAKHLTETLNGTLQIESEKNKGTAITVSIPF